jgi:hypothetical protein
MLPFFPPLFFSLLAVFLRKTNVREKLSTAGGRQVRVEKEETPERHYGKGDGEGGMCIWERAE